MASENPPTAAPGVAVDELMRLADEYAASYRSHGSCAADRAALRTALLAGAAGRRVSAWKPNYFELQDAARTYGLDYNKLCAAVRAIHSNDTAVPVRAPQVTDDLVRAALDFFTANCRATGTEEVVRLTLKFAASRLGMGALPASPMPFDCWSTNNGDSWYEDPADAQIIQDLLGHSPLVGEEYVVLAGWTAQQATYRVTSVTPDGDCEVTCVSHPRLAATTPSAAPAEPIPAMHLVDGSSNPDWLAFKYSVLNAASDMMRAVMIEREACAVICDQLAGQYARQAREGDNSGASDHREDAARECAEDIRALRDVSAPPPGEVQVDAARAKIPDYTINVSVGDGAYMCITNPVTDPQIGYSLTYSGDLNQPQAGRFSAAALIDSYNYLVSHEISLKEATRRLALMRQARDAAIASTTPPVNSGGA